MPKFRSAQLDRQLADVLPFGIALVDASGYPLWWNRVAERMFGFYSEDNQDSSVVKLLMNSDFPKIFADKEEHSQVEIDAPYRSNRRLRLQLRSYGDNTWLVISEDITDIHKLRGIRQDFVANVSHELRTPLTVFCGYLELLLEKPDEDVGVLVEMLRQMSSQAKRMQNLISDLLWLSRLETKSVSPASLGAIDAVTLIDYVYRDGMALAKTKGKRLDFRLAIDQQLQIKGDLEELRSAFANIISNAVRYTPDGGKISICWYEDASGIKFEVRDTGIGIPDKHISRITQRFYRTNEARSCEQGGSGLGLAIVKHVLLRNNGKLEIESREGVGSTFRCVFPLQQIVQSPALI